MICRHGIEPWICIHPDCKEHVEPAASEASFYPGGQVYPAAKRRTYSCMKCGLTFETKPALESHLLLSKHDRRRADRDGAFK